LAQKITNLPRTRSLVMAAVPGGGGNPSIQKIGLDRAGPDVEREMLLQRLRIERFAGFTPAHPGLGPKNR
jgi:hypothetical protein